MALITRETGPSAKGSVLSFAEMDNNLIYLQGLTKLDWSSSDTNLTIYALGTQSTPTRPATPSIIVTVDKISSITGI